MSSAARTLRMQLITTIQRPAAQLNTSTTCDIFTYKGSALYDENSIADNQASIVTRPFTKMAVDTLLMV